jgi:hypothetical protein
MEACPLDSRRGVTEVFIKRLAVLFATLCLQGHLNSLRGMKGSNQLPMSILLFFTNPVYPLCVIIFDIGWAIFKSQVDARAVYRPIGFTGGAAPTDFYIAAAIGMHASYDESDSDNGGIIKTSMAILRLAHSATSMEKTKEGLGIKKIGRLVVLAAIGVQCSATVILGIRREQHGAATPSDRWNYLYAISGLAILAQTVVAQLLSRTYAVTRDFNVDKVSEHGVSVFVEILHYWVSLVGISYFSGDESIPTCSFLIAFFALCPLLWPWHTFFEGWEDVRRSVSGILMLCLLGFTYPLASAAASVWYFALLKYNPPSDDFMYVPGYQVPTNISCPFLWEDPLANALWAF